MNNNHVTSPSISHLTMRNKDSFHLVCRQRTQHYLCCFSQNFVRRRNRTRMSRPDGPLTARRTGPASANRSRPKCGTGRCEETYRQTEQVTLLQEHLRHVSWQANVCLQTLLFLNLTLLIPGLCLLFSRDPF